MAFLHRRKPQSVDSRTFEEGAAPTDSHAESRARMVLDQIEKRGVRDPRVLDAMRAAPRHRFIPSSQLADAYADHPLSIGCGQTISQPYIVALMTELAEPGPEDRVLEIGTGCGYQTFVLALLARHVYTMEIHASLQEDARRRLEEMVVRNVSYRAADGFAGWPEEAPFHVIMATAAPRSIPPALKDQLAEGGRLVIPVGPEMSQDLRVIRRKGDDLREESIIPVRFVPMTGGE